MELLSDRSSLAVRLELPLRIGNTKPDTGVGRWFWWKVAVEGPGGQRAGKRLSAAVHGQTAAETCCMVVLN